MTKILVMEDEQSLLEEVLDMLRFEEFDAIGAENGEVGVRMAREHLPDLIICDIMMPKLNGYGVLLELHSDPSTSMIPFIFLTAKADREQLRYGMDLGADDYITKPFTHDELLNAIHTRLERQRSLQEKYEQRLDDLRQAIVLALPHELRTPLTSIIGYAELMSMDSEYLDAEQISEMATSILKAGQRLHRQIENYLLYAQLEIIKLDPGWIIRLHENRLPKPADVIQNVANQRAHEAQREQDLTLTLDNATARISRESLEKIVLELVDNAFKFSKAGTPINIHGFSTNSDYVITVEDRGRGMKAEQVQALGAYMQFERKLHEQQGSGLGLILARRLSEIYGGSLSIESVPDKGTRVTLTIPLC